MLLCAFLADASNGAASCDGSYARPLGQAEEEDAFWMLVVMVERLLPNDSFSDGLTGVRVDSEILIDLMRDLSTARAGRRLRLVVWKRPVGIRD